MACDFLLIYRIIFMAFIYFTENIFHRNCLLIGLWLCWDSQSGWGHLTEFEIFQSYLHEEGGAPPGFIFLLDFMPSKNSRISSSLTTFLLFANLDKYVLHQVLLHVVVGVEWPEFHGRWRCPPPKWEKNFVGEVRLFPVLLITYLYHSCIVSSAEYTIDTN